MTSMARRPGALLAPGLVGAGVVAGALLAWQSAGNAATPPESFSTLAKQVAPAVVNIASERAVTSGGDQMPEMPFDFPPGSPFEKFFKQFREGPGQDRHDRHARAVGIGSGFIVDPSGYIVTNNHVVEKASDIKVRLDDDAVYPAKLIGTDPQTDLALLKIEAKRKLPSVAFGDSDKAEVGDWVLAVGNPFGLGGTVTAGIISARGRNIQAGPYDDFLQIDASINRGNSGGPLFTLDGKVVGVNTAIFSPNGGSVGIGFAIPSNLAKSVIAELKQNGAVERGWLGVSIQNVTPEIAQSLGLKAADGAIVASVQSGSPAEKAGLKQGDVIVGFDGDKVDGSRELARLVAARHPGSEVALKVWRGEREVELSLTTGKQPAPERMASAESDEGSPSSFHSETLGADLAALTPARRQQMGLPDELSGVLVLNLDNGPAYDHGLRGGDVIKQVGDTTVSTPDELERVVKQLKAKAKKSVLLLINRAGHDIFLGVDIGVA